MNLILRKQASDISIQKRRFQNGVWGLFLPLVNFNFIAFLFPVSISMLTNLSRDNLFSLIPGLVLLVPFADGESHLEAVKPNALMACASRQLADLALPATLLWLQISVIHHPWWLMPVILVLGKCGSKGIMSSVPTWATYQVPSNLGYRVRLSQNLLCLVPLIYKWEKFRKVLNMTFIFSIFLLCCLCQLLRANSYLWKTKNYINSHVYNGYTRCSYVYTLGSTVRGVLVPPQGSNDTRTKRKQVYIG